MFDEKPEYQVTATSYFHDQLYEAGARVVYEGDPGHNLEPLNDAARERKKAWEGRELAGPAPHESGFFQAMAKRNIEDGDAKSVGRAPPYGEGPNGPNAILTPPTSGPAEPDTKAIRAQRKAERVAAEAEAKVVDLQAERDAAVVERDTAKSDWDAAMSQKTAAEQDRDAAHQLASEQAAENEKLRAENEALRQRAEAAEAKAKPTE